MMRQGYGNTEGGKLTDLDPRVLYSTYNLHGLHRNLVHPVRIRSD